MKSRAKGSRAIGRGLKQAPETARGRSLRGVCPTEAERRRVAADLLLAAPRPSDLEPDWADVERQLRD